MEGHSPLELHPESERQSKERVLDLDHLERETCIPDYGRHGGTFRSFIKGHDRTSVKVRKTEDNLSHQSDRHLTWREGDPQVGNS